MPHKWIQFTDRCMLTFTKLESIKKDGKVVGYEASVIGKDGKKVGIEMNADGTVGK